MEKLIELLNEFEKENWRNFEVKEIWMTYRNNDLMVISKKYWFIKWLVDSDKIDFKKLDTTLIKYWLFKNIWFYEWLLMLLSISDTPIDDLILYLK